MTREQGRKTGFGSFALTFGAAALLSACAHNKTMASAAKPAAPAPAVKTASAAKPAAPAAPETFAQAAKGLSVHKFWGVVQSVDAKDDSVTLKSRRGAVKDFMVLSDTKLNRGGADVSVTFAALKAGEHLRVVYAGKYAKDIHVMILAHGA
ncbi:MAG: hypothetical protein KGL04_05405 [Elusimicrobia bacterium]|nr:hypothetical protein [Elusimicrobiota bacterium]